MTNEDKIIRKDRLRFEKNKLSSGLTYLAILFNVFYFVNLYAFYNNNYYYNIKIGASIVYNLLFLLLAFLSSEGVKNYKMNMSIVLIVIGLLQIVRIFYIPLQAHSTMVIIDQVERPVMLTGQFIFEVLCLIASCVSAVVAGAFGVIRTLQLKSRYAEIEAEKNNA